MALLARGAQAGIAPKTNRKEGNMRRNVSLFLAIILIITCSGCFWYDRGGRGDQDRGGYGDRDRGERGDDRNRGEQHEERH